MLLEWGSDHLHDGSYCLILVLIVNPPPQKPHLHGPKTTTSGCSSETVKHLFLVTTPVTTT